jgi:uncharacterized protein (DUF433 family)
MAVNRIVSDASEAVANIRLFYSTPVTGPFWSTITYARNWYAAKGEDGAWLFGPAKFIGYGGNMAEALESEPRDGRMLETALREWFDPVVEGHALEAELKSALRRFLASHGKPLHQLARVHVLKRDVPHLAPARPKTSDESWRITANPEILGGKPCIRGIRIRVADILEMLADGASRQDILEDFPYLEDRDITAALEFARNAVDHRLIKAA